MQKNATYPYTRDQLKYFKAELREAGGVDELMIKKEALKRNGEMTLIVTIKDIEGYKRKHLTGIYKPLQAVYNTEVPYVFWSRVYDMLRRI